MDHVVRNKTGINKIITQKIIALLFALPALCLLTATTVEAGDQSNISSIASIVMHLKHYPSSSEKERLAAIIVSAADATAGEKALAHALKNMQHKISGSDATVLQHLQTNSSASQQERQLATILLGIAHSPSEQDKKILQTLID